MSWLRTLPKTELHLHLEGAIPTEAMWFLIEKYGAAAEIGSRKALEERFVFRDFAHFIQTWIWKNGFLKEYEDFRFIAAKFAEDLARQNIVYAEVFYSPGEFEERGLKIGGITESIRQGLDEFSEHVEIKLVADLIRNFGPEKGAEWLAQVYEVKELGVVGIGIGGSEQSYPPEPYADVYAKARHMGFKTSAHAGEAAGPESIRGAVEVLQVDRIGHGTRLVEDAKLLHQVVEQQIPIELCPISNVKTGVVSSMGAHPAKQLFDCGAKVSVNTDDPQMFNNSLELEFESLMVALGFTKSDVKKLLMNAIDMAWCDEMTRDRLHRELQRAWSENSLSGTTD